jgi:hypothetical protein
LTTWTDAGYGGISTRSQSGVIIAWGGCVILWRSSRQCSAAQSTCEAEVGAGAMGYQILEGVRALLDEWQIVINTPTLLIDNKSALSIAEFGGSWRTRYFAVRAARLAEESETGRISLRYCPTLVMLADALTKLGTAPMLERLRAALGGDLPEVPTEEQTVKGTDATWWAALVRTACMDNGDGETKRSASPRAVDSKEEPDPASAAATVPKDDNKTKRRRGQKRAKETGDQRSKKRKDDEFKPDWD